MSDDKRDVLEVLRYELNFLEQGGYGNWYSTPWGPASIFQDSLTCPNHGDPTRPHACHECLLYDFVPEEYRTEDVPCHHIPLNRQGVTVATPDQTEEELRENVKHWLKRTIARIEADRAKQKAEAGDRRRPDSQPQYSAIRACAEVAGAVSRHRFMCPSHFGTEPRKNLFGAEFSRLVCG